MIELKNSALYVCDEKGGGSPIRDGLIVGIRNAEDYVQWGAPEVHFENPENNSQAISFGEFIMSIAGVQTEEETPPPKYFVELLRLKDGKIDNEHFLSQEDKLLVLQTLVGLREVYDTVRKSLPKVSLQMITSTGDVFPIFHTGIIIIDKETIIPLGFTESPVAITRIIYTVCQLFGIHPDPQTVQLIQEEKDRFDLSDRFNFIHDLFYNGHVVVEIENKEEFDQFIEDMDLYADPLPEEAFEFYKYFTVRPGTTKLVPIRKIWEYKWEKVVRAKKISELYNQLYNDTGYSDIGVEGIFNVLTSYNGNLVIEE